MKRLWWTWSLCWLVACGSNTTATQDDAAVEDAAAGSDAAGDVQASAPACDPIHPAWCGLPWPSNLYLAQDTATATGYRLQFGAETLPKNPGGHRIDPAAYTFLDGYSIGTPLMMQWPNLDATGLPSEPTMAGSVEKTANIVLLEVAGGKVVRHVPYFVELDGTEKDPAKQVLIVRPTEILKAATRYVVGVRGLKDKDGHAYTPAPEFAALVAGTATGFTATRQARFDEVFGLLSGEGVQKTDLQLAWDFVTASDAAEHDSLLALRDAAQKVTGDSGPELKVTQVTEFSEAENADIALEITGTFHAPNFTEKDSDGVVHLHLGSDGKVAQNGWRDVEFRARIPRGALDGTPHGLLMYGHGLNGGPDEIGGGYLGTIAHSQKRIVYGCPMWGMSEPDTADIMLSLQDMRKFPGMIAKLRQGMAEHIVLQRAMRERFGQLDEVKKRGIVIDKARNYYYGNSQGGIYGGTLMALSTDITRGGLGVVGNNYSILLQRSVDFEEFFVILKGVYPDTRDMGIVLATIQLQWDAVDPVTHYRHLKQEPYPGTPAHEVLADIAVGDYQVAPVTMEIAIRSQVGIQLMANWGKDVWGVTPQPYPFKGSGIVSYSFGNPWASPGNLPPPDLKSDPHGKVRKNAQHQEQLNHFLETGEIIDVCGGKPCYFGP